MNVRDNNDYTFIMRDGTHSKSVYKWIMNLGASKHITLHKTAFNIYEIIILYNMYLDDNNIVEAIEMGSIIVEAIVEGKINQIRIKVVLHVSRLYTNLFSMNKLVSNGLKVQFNLNKCIVKSCDSEAIVIVPRKGNLYDFFFCKGARSGCNQLSVTSNGRWRARALTSLPWPFECEGCSYVSKHDE